MSVKHAGPSSYRPKNQASKPSRGAKGAVEAVSPGKSEPRKHEARSASAPRSRGKGKATPRFTKFTKF